MALTLCRQLMQRLPLPLNELIISRRFRNVGHQTGG
jgi:hypothetical protein